MKAYRGRVGFPIAVQVAAPALGKRVGRALRTLGRRRVVVGVVRTVLAAVRRLLLLGRGWGRREQQGGGHHVALVDGSRDADADGTVRRSFQRPDGHVQVGPRLQRRVVDVHDPVARHQPSVHLRHALGH